MPDQSELFALREDLKRKLSDGTYDPLAERVVKWAGRIFPRLPKGAPASYLASSFAHILLSIFLNLFDGAQALRGRLSMIIAVAFMVWIGPFLYARLYRQLYRALSGYVVDALPQARDIRNLSRALALFSNPFLSALFVTGYALAVTSYIVSLLEVNYGAFSAASTLMVASAHWILGVILYHVLFLMLFPLILSRYDVDLYELDPGASPSIRHLSVVIRNSSYQISVYATLVTLYIAYVVRISTPLLSGLFLTPVLGIFIFRQIALSLIIGRARWTTLERLSARMEALDVERRFGDAAVQNQYKAMLDYYNRVKNAETGIFDARTGTLLFNSFLLPLIAFVLFQFDRIAAFIDRYLN